MKTFTVLQAAEILNVGKARVHALIRNERLVVASRYPRLLLVSESSVYAMKRELDEHPRRGGGWK